MLYKIPNNHFAGILFSHLFWCHLNPTFSILLPSLYEATEPGLPTLPASRGQLIMTDLCFLNPSSFGGTDDRFV